MSFDAGEFQEKFDGFTRDQQGLRKSVADHGFNCTISTMTFTSSISGCRDDLFNYLLQLNMEGEDGVDITDQPIIKKSAFCHWAVEIQPFPSSSEHSSVRVRIFCKTKSVLIVGCTDMIECIAALDDICRLVGGKFTFPCCRLINANVNTSRRVSLSSMYGRLTRDADFHLVERPERQHRLICHHRNGVKMMIYGTGKVSVHGNSSTPISIALRRLFRHIIG
jgi:hypothetical protein